MNAPSHVLEHHVLTWNQENFFFSSEEICPLGSEDEFPHPFCGILLGKLLQQQKAKTTWVVHSFQPTVGKDVCINFLKWIKKVLHWFASN